MPQSSIAPIRQPRLLPPNADEAWPDDIWDVLVCCDTGMPVARLVTSAESVPLPKSLRAK